MNGIEKIVARMETDAEAERTALQAETDARCEALRAEYEEKAQKEYSDRLQKGMEECRARAERLAGTADMEARKSILNFKQNMISDIFKDAERQLAALPKADYIRFLASLAAKAAAYGDEELVFNEADAKEVGKEVAKAANALLGAKGHLTVAEETRRIPGGIIIKHGDIETNCAVDTLVQLRRSELAPQVAEMLFN